MTAAELERNTKGGKALLQKYGREHYVALGKKGGGRPKSIVYKQPEKINKRRMPASYPELLKAVFSMQNLIEGGLRYR